MSKIFLVFLLFSSAFGLAHESSFLPKNTLQIGENSRVPSGISEADFDAVLEELEEIYRPLIAAAGGTLNVEKVWKSKEVNAYARQFENNDWRIIFMGGMARHKHMTRDAFSLVVCHELGHHLGGAPNYSGEVSWASNEGQSDYFAIKCLRRLWQNADNAAAIREKPLPKLLEEKCRTEWKTGFDQTLCLRIGLASSDIGNLFGSLATFGKLPKFETPDPKVVKVTDGGHPKAQCRLDTFFQGSLCHVSYAEDFDKKDETIGSCHPALGDKIGNRPLCWYAPTP